MMSKSKYPHPQAGTYTAPVPVLWVPLHGRVSTIDAKFRFEIVNSIGKYDVEIHRYILYHPFIYTYLNYYFYKNNYTMGVSLRFTFGCDSRLNQRVVCVYLPRWSKLASIFCWLAHNDKIGIKLKLWLKSYLLLLHLRVDFKVQVSLCFKSVEKNKK